MKKPLVAVVVGCLIVGGFFWWRNGSASSSEMPVEMKTAVATRGSLRQEVECNGTVAANREIEIKCRASGEIVKLPFDISDAVKKGDLLLELDPVDQERIVQQSQATLAASEARLAQAENNLLTAQQTLEAERQKALAALDASRARVEDTKAKAKRQQELLEKKFSSPEQYETARTAAVQAEQDLRTAEARMGDLKAQELDLETKRQEIKLAKAQVENNKIALALANRQLGYTKVYAPIDGVISDRKVEIGQIISSGVTNVGGGTTAMMLADLSRVFVYASVDESYIGQVELGQSAIITVDAYPNLRFEGKVDRIGTKGINVQNVITFEVRIEVMSENKRLLKPVMTANVSIIIAEKPDALVVPSSSIYRQKHQPCVTLVKQDGTFEEDHGVETGISDGVNTEIVSGLAEGDTVVVFKPEDESRWRTSSEAATKRRQDRIMYKALGGGSGGRR